MKNFNLGKKKKPAPSNTSADMPTPPKSKSKLPFIKSKARPTPIHNKSIDAPKGTIASPSLTQKPGGLLKKTPKKKQANWLLVMILLGIILAGLWLYFTKFADNEPTLAPSNTETAVESNNANNVIQEVDPSSATDVSTMTTDNDTSDNNATLANFPDPEEILEAPLPENEVLAKEEIQRLEDQQIQLQEQEKLIAEQVAMMDELNAKKAEQIELLEAQIAQLEAQ